MTREALHPHNEALQVIDRKIAILTQTIEYMASDSVEGSNGSYVFQKQYQEAIDRSKSLNRTRKLLIKLDGGSVDFVKKVEDGVGGSGSRSGRIRKVALVDDEGNVIRKFNSISDAERRTDINRSTISYLLNRGKDIKTAMNFIFLPNN